MWHWWWKRLAPFIFTNPLHTGPGRVCTWVEVDQCSLRKSFKSIIALEMGFVGWGVISPCLFVHIAVHLLVEDIPLTSYEIPKIYILQPQICGCKLQWVGMKVWIEEQDMGDSMGERIPVAANACRWGCREELHWWRGIPRGSRWEPLWNQAEECSDYFLTKWVIISGEVAGSLLQCFERHRWWWQGEWWPPMQWTRTRRVMMLTITTLSPM